MPHSLRARLSGLHYKKIISDKDYDRLCKALDNEKILDKIRAEIMMKDGLEEALEIIDKYRGEVDCRECKTEYDCYECEKYEESEDKE